MPGLVKLLKRYLVALLVLITGSGLAAVFSPRSASGGETHDTIVAEGGGTTIIHGGTGPSGGFVPVLTTVAFHAERTGGHVTGSFDCLALVPETSTRSQSGQISINFQYRARPRTGAAL